MIRSTGRALLPLLLAAIPASGALRAQGAIFTVIGVVRDTSGAPIPGAEVLYPSSKRSVMTNDAGVFRLDSIPPGDRRLVVRRIGYLSMHPLVKVPQAPGDTLRVNMLEAAVLLPALVVESDLPGIRGVVGDTAYHALPGTLVELLGAQRADTTDERGRFGFEGLRPDRTYVLRFSKVGYLARLFAVDLKKKGKEYSVFLDRYRRGLFDWANSNEAGWALPDLASRLATESRNSRMTADELARYGTTALCDIARLRVPGHPYPYILLRGVTEMKNASLCAWNADELELVEWGNHPCSDAAQTIASVLHFYCGPKHQPSFGYATPVQAATGWVAIWPKG